MFSTILILGPIFGLMVLGYMAAQSGLLSIEGTRGLTLLASSIEIPVLLFRSIAFASAENGGGWLMALAYLFGCIGVLAIAFIASRFLLGLDSLETGLFGMGTIYSNSSLIGIPVAQSLFGDSGVVLVSKIITLHSVVLIPAAAAYLSLMNKQSERGAKKVLPTLLNPMILGLAAGYLFAGIGANLPMFGVRIVDSLALAATPTALVAVGATLKQLSPFAGIRASLTAVALKLVAHPLLVWMIATAMGLTYKAIIIATITAALPPGINAYAMAVQYGRYQDETVRSFALATIFSAGTITILMLATSWNHAFL